MVPGERARALGAYVDVVIAHRATGPTLLRDIAAVLAAFGDDLDELIASEPALPVLAGRAGSVGGRPAARGGRGGDGRGGDVGRARSLVSRRGDPRGPAWTLLPRFLLAVAPPLTAVALPLTAVGPRPTAPDPGSRWRAHVDLCVPRFSAPLWLYPGEGSWHFVSVPGTSATRSRTSPRAARKGFGSVRVDRHRRRHDLANLRLPGPRPARTCSRSRRPSARSKTSPRATRSRRGWSWLSCSGRRCGDFTWRSGGASAAVDSVWGSVECRGVMRRSRGLVGVLGVVLAIGTAVVAPGNAVGAMESGGDRHDSVRFATFNASLNRGAAGQLVTDLSTPRQRAGQRVAEVIQRNRPDVLLINEFDYVPDNSPRTCSASNYLERGQNGAAPIDYPYAFVAPSNTGDPDRLRPRHNDGHDRGGDDAFGFGAVRGPVRHARAVEVPDRHPQRRTFQKFLWKDMPGALLPDDPATPAPRTGTRRRSSTSSGCRRSRTGTCRSRSAAHRALPGRRTRRRPPSTAPRTATAPATTTRSGSGRTTSARQAARYIYDDEGRHGGLGRAARSSSPATRTPTRSTATACRARSSSCSTTRGSSTRPRRRGAAEAAELQGGANATHQSDPYFDTADFNGHRARATCAPTTCCRRGTCAPRVQACSGRSRRIRCPRLTGVFPFPTSDHRLVWLDVQVPGWH